MEPSDKKQFAEALIATGELYDKDISVALAEIFFIDLKEYSINQVIDALGEHRKDPKRGQFFPKPADLIDKLTIDTHALALAAWPEVERLAANSAAAVSDDPVTEVVVSEMGGWSRFGKAQYREYPFLQREFIERYETYTTTPRLLEQASKSITRVNKPVRIGNG
jgi:hypothetical protein